MAAAFKLKLCSEERMEKVPKEFWKYEEVFQEERNVGLPVHRPGIDHEIPLKEGATLKRHPLRQAHPEKKEFIKKTICRHVRWVTMMLEGSGGANPAEIRLGPPEP